jgi:hypothetical protein
MSFPAPAALRDSQLRQSDLREIVLAMLSRTLTALVPSMTHGPVERADRTPSRLPLALNAVKASLAGIVRKTWRQPAAVWTITHEERTTQNLGSSQHSLSAVPHHTNYNCPEPRAESPRGTSGAANDETRTTHQRSGARNPRRDPRGRSARRAAG